MTVQTRPGSTRSNRDKLEKLQEQLRAARGRRATLQREKAELITRTSALEEEMRGLRRALGMTQGELDRPAPSLPDQFLLPFSVSPALRTVYGRVRTAVKLLPSSMVLGGHMALGLVLLPGNFILVGLAAMIGALLVLLLLHPVPEDGDAFPHWSFDEEGFFPIETGSEAGKVLYREIQQVRSAQGVLQRLSRLGSVHVTWTPGQSTSLGRAARGGTRSVSLPLIEEPERLASWLRERAQGLGGGSEGAARVD